jgi:uncharacterized protein YjeT (DUF2065 family)
METELTPSAWKTLAELRLSGPTSWNRLLLAMRPMSADGLRRATTDLYRAELIGNDDGVYFAL